ncbi:MAG: PAS domain S-box protein [Thermodesulfovibrionales bacterium]|nr:PAS domain S-box protein [Thermodesulfovibrionales bacterium]
MKTTKKFFLIFFFLSTIFLPNPATSEIPQKKNVLVLNSYHKGLSWTDNIIKGIESVIGSDNPKIELFFEYMDTKRFFDKRYFERFYKLLKQKYHQQKFSLIIATDNDALDFLNQKAHQLFPDTPIVFCGINNFKDSMLSNKKLFTGVIEETDMKSTLDIALKLHPNTKQVYVINDKTTTGIALKAELLRIMPYFQSRVSFIFLDDLDIDELRTVVKKLPLNSIILMLIVNRDKKGQFFTYEESLAVVRNNSEVPIYGLWDFYIGKGIVGGMLTSAFHQGKAAAELANKILEGENVANLSIIKKSPNILMFDFKELRRFNISLTNLPDDIILINQPDTFYSKYKRFIITTLGIITVLSLIILSLALNIINRKKTEQLLRESEEKYRDLYDNAPDMYHSVNKDSIIIDCNETEAKMLGYKKEEIIGRPITDFFTEKSKQDHEREFPLLKLKGSGTSIEREFVRKDGTTFLASLNVFIEKDEKGELIKTRTIARDITRQKLIEEELKRSREELRNLSIHLQTAIEEERRHIAREIHDELGHALTTLKLDLSWLKKKLPTQSVLATKTDSMINIVNQTVNAVQKISSELRPGVLDYLSLADAIEWQLRELHRRTKIKCNLKNYTDFDIINLERDRSTAIFRIFQESITNIIRHSMATLINVSLDLKGSTLILFIEDNGKGIQEEQLFDPMSFGILGMRERACFLGGDIKIIGQQGKGTIVELKVPLKDTEYNKIDKGNNSG